MSRVNKTNRALCRHYVDDIALYNVSRCTKQAHMVLSREIALNGVSIGSYH